jgi:hypothetical protein
VATPKVAELLQRGYFIHDRLLRPALVRVAVPAPSGAAAAVRGTGDGAEG